MARTRADLGAGVRLTDLVSLGVIGRAFPLARVKELLAATGKGSRRGRLLHDALVGPIATPQTQGAWHGRWHLMSLDRSTLNVPDTQANAPVFGRQEVARGHSAFPLSPLSTFRSSISRSCMRFPNGGSPPVVDAPTRAA